MVHRWSDTVFDKIDKGEIEWADREDVHYARIRISVSAGSNNQRPVEVMCPGFKNGICSVKADHHTEGSVNLLHMCAHCNAGLVHKV